jgi:tetratricopeptide (TPR) repeat protein
MCPEVPMNRFALLLLALQMICLLAAPALQADFRQDMAQADLLHKHDAHEEVRGLLEAGLARATDGRQQAEIYWRLARAWLNLGDQAEDRGAKGDALLAFFARGEELAQKGIDADPENHLTYYWKSATTGRWGQVKGILNALFKAKPMRDLLQKALVLRPDHADSYYVLGQLFEQVPGGLSFGDKDWAVSLGRKAADLRAVQVRAGEEEELVYDYYTELAKHLWERNWSQGRRQKEQAKKAAQYAANSDPMEKNCYYEGSLTLEDLSDREEARKLLDWTVGELEALPRRTQSEEDDLQEALELQAGWKK